MSDKEPSEILTCDTCGSPIGDVENAMVFWDTAEGTVLGPVRELRVAHKRRCDINGLGRSTELGWFKDPLEALAWLASNSDAYEWTPTQLQRLIEVAWAVAEQASAEKRSDLSSEI